MSVFEAKLEIEIDGIYKTVSNIREISVLLIYKLAHDNTIGDNNWLATLEYGGIRELVISIVGIMSKKQDTDAIQLFDLLLQNYCARADSHPQAGSFDRYRLLLPNGKAITAYYTVTNCELVMYPGKFDEYHAQLNSCGLPNYE